MGQDHQIITESNNLILTSIAVAADEKVMEQIQERRTNFRLLCAEIVQLFWQDELGRERRQIGNLEDISLSGLCLQLESPLPMGTRIVLQYGDGELVGHVRHSLRRDECWFIGVQLDDGCRWSSEHFRPKHLLDPRELMQQLLIRRGDEAGAGLVN